MDNITLNFRNELPEELDALLDGIEVNEQLQTIDYKLLRDEMYAKRPI